MNLTQSDFDIIIFLNLKNVLQTVTRANGFLSHTCSSIRSFWLHRWVLRGWRSNLSDGSLRILSSLLLQLRGVERWDWLTHGRGQGTLRKVNHWRCLDRAQCRLVQSWYREASRVELWRFKLSRSTRGSQKGGSTKIPALYAVLRCENWGRE